MVKIAIIGAGLSGLTLGNLLANKADVTIYEKSRGYGGRIATRYYEDFFFDHGAQFFTVKSDAFGKFIRPMIEEGVLAEWHARFAEINKDGVIRTSTWDSSHPHYVGVPGMNAIGKYLARDLNISLETKVNKIVKNKAWEIYDDNNNSLGIFDWVIVAAPLAQAADIMPAEYKYTKDFEKISMLSCFSLMLGFNISLNLGFDAALVKDRDISWISVNSSKPGRNGKFTMLIHSTNKWASQHIDDDMANVQSHLVAEVGKVIGQDVKNADHIAIQPWRYANIKKHHVRFDIDAENKLAVSGDWCIKGRVESAFISASRVYNQLVEYL